MPRSAHHSAMSREAWTVRFAELLEYKEKYGDCNVPRKFVSSSSSKLGRWVNKQRGQYKAYQRGEPSPMNPERIALLEKEGFLWSIRNVRKRDEDESILTANSTGTVGGGGRQSVSTRPIRATNAGFGEVTYGVEYVKGEDAVFAAVPVDEGQEEEVKCSGCNGSRDGEAEANEEVILLCDGCDREYHLGCSGLNEVPEGDFYCSYCNDNGKPPVTPPNSGTTAKTKSRGSSKTRKKRKAPSPSSSPASADIIEEATHGLDDPNGEATHGLDDPNDDDDADGDDDGVCNVCHGARDAEAEANKEPILLCDGLRCKKEFHLCCIAAPEGAEPLKEVPEGSFFCTDCEKRGGATEHLEAYLDQTEDNVAAFNSSRQYVHHLLRKQMMEALAAEGAAEATRPMDETTSSHGTARKRSRKASSAENEFLDWPERICPPKSELSKVSESYIAAMADVVNSSRSSDKSWRTPGIATTTSSGNDESNESTSEYTNAQTKDTSTSTKLRSAFFVGKPIQLYCPLDNCYHHGRIVDWRVSSRGLPEYYGNDEIAKSEFLIRFASGVNGRRRALHRWILLEEHSVAVSIGTVFAQVSKGRGLTGWKPAQLISRSSLELIGVRRLLIEDDGPRGLCFVFGATSHAYLKLHEEVVNFNSPVFCAQRGETIGKGQEKYKNVDLPVLLAFLEQDEQQRVNNWGRMPLLNLSHERALRARDEYALDPLVIPFCGSRVTQNEGEEDSEATSPDKNGGVPVQGRSTKTKIFCPQIERGVDRQWLAHLANGENVQMRRTLDTMLSLKVKSVACMASAMNRLQDQRESGGGGSSRKSFAGEGATVQGST